MGFAAKALLVGLMVMRGERAAAASEAVDQQVGQEQQKQEQTRHGHAHHQRGFRQLPSKRQQRRLQERLDSLGASREGPEQPQRRGKRRKLLSEESSTSSSGSSYNDGVSTGGWNEGEMELVKEEGEEKNKRSKKKERKVTSPRIPYCRKHMHMANMYIDVVDTDSKIVQREKRLILFGGKGQEYNYKPHGQVFLNDQWALHITNTGFTWTQMLTNHIDPAIRKSHKQFPSIQEGQDLTSPEQPEARWKFGMQVYHKDELFLFGGDDENDGDGHFLGDLWSYKMRHNTSERSWKALERFGTNPGARRGHITTIVNNSTFLVQGGKTKGQGEDKHTCDLGTFSLNVSDSKALWVQRASFPGVCRWGGTMSTVQSKALNMHLGLPSKRELAVVFGGRLLKSHAYEYFSELWAYDMVDDMWHLIWAPDMPGKQPKQQEAGEEQTIPGGLVLPAKAPMARDHHGAMYVPEVDRFYVHGGRFSDAMVPPLEDLWAFDFEAMAWAELEGPPRPNGMLRSIMYSDLTASSPEGRFGHSMAAWRGGADDGLEPVLVVFGGETVSESGIKALMNDVWTYNIGTNRWRMVSRADCSPGADGIIVPPPVNLAFLLALAAALIMGGLVLLCDSVSKAARRKRMDYVNIS